jgi:hypothetical protein
MKTYWGNKRIAPRILKLRRKVEVNGQRHAPSCFIPGERSTGTHWTGGWVGPRGGLDAVVKRELPSPCLESYPGRPTRSLVTALTDLSL